MKNEYSLITKLEEELADFKKPIQITTANKSEGMLRYGLGSRGYDFNQLKAVELFKMVYNSQYIDGPTDADGQRKLYLNITRFLVDVYTKNTDLDVKDFQFQPEERMGSIYEAFLFQRYFGIWVKDNGFSALINDLNNDLGKYGTCVIKKVKNSIIRIPLTELFNGQKYETLKKAVESGSYVGQKHTMTHIQTKDYKGWKKVDFYEGERVVYERYALTPRSAIEYYTTGKGKIVNDDYVLTVSFIMRGNARKDLKDEVLFIEQVDEIPYLECHSCKEDGRWLGIGQVEIQYENQLARNVSINLRRKSLLWGAKKVFMSKSDTNAKNLLRDVEDGEVLNVGVKGDIVQVDMSTRAHGDYSELDRIVGENTQQKSFAFEIATGESLPAGTPFRLGAIVDNSAEKYYNRQREIFGIFLRNVYQEKLIPIFKAKASDYLHIIAQGEAGYDLIKKAAVECYKSSYFKKLALSADFFTKEAMSEEELEQYILKEMDKSPVMYIESKKDMYANAKYRISIDPTGESKNYQQDAQTLSSLYQILAQKGDPRADELLSQIMNMYGKDFKPIGAYKGKPMQMNAQPMQGQGQPMQNLAPAQ